MILYGGGNVTFVSFLPCSHIAANVGCCHSVHRSIPCHSIPFVRLAQRFGSVYSVAIGGCVYIDEFVLYFTVKYGLWNLHHSTLLHAPVIVCDAPFGCLCFKLQKLLLYSHINVYPYKHIIYLPIYVHVAFCYRPQSCVPYRTISIRMNHRSLYVRGI